MGCTCLPHAVSHVLSHVLSKPACGMGIEGGVVRGSVSRQVESACIGEAMVGYGPDGWSQRKMDASVRSQMHCHDGAACSLSTDITSRQSPPRPSTAVSQMRQMHDWSVRWMGGYVNRQKGRSTDRLTRHDDRVGPGRQKDGKVACANQNI